VFNIVFIFVQSVIHKDFYHSNLVDPKFKDLLIFNGINVGFASIFGTLSSANQILFHLKKGVSLIYAINCLIYETMIFVLSSCLIFCVIYFSDDKIFKILTDFETSFIIKSILIFILLIAIGIFLRQKIQKIEEWMKIIINKRLNVKEWIVTESNSTKFKNLSPLAGILIWNFEASIIALFCDIYFDDINFFHTYPTILAMICASYLVGLLTFIPGGWGSRELIQIYFLSKFGFTIGDATLLVGLLRLSKVMSGVSLSGVAILFVRRMLV
jgi:uncharacterized membrane protein YbhN (UPF0104 family)